jgi:hypothetical protein
VRKFVSRKLIAALAGVATVVLTQVGMAEQAAQQITDAVVWIVSTYLIGQGAVDTMDAAKAKPA